LASALEVGIEELRRTPEEQARLDAETLQAIKEFEQRYELIQMETIERASKLGSLFSSMDALVFDTVDLNSDAEEDAVSTLKVVVQDCLDVWKDFPVSHRDVEKEIQQLLEDLRRLQLLVTAGLRAKRLRCTTGNTAPFTWQVLYLRVSRESDKVQVLVLDKKAPIALG
jgi:hypothetical protein